MSCAIGAQTSEHWVSATYGSRVSRGADAGLDGGRRSMSHAFEGDGEVGAGRAESRRRVELVVSGSETGPRRPTVACDRPSSLSSTTNSARKSLARRSAVATAQHHTLPHVQRRRYDGEAPCYLFCTSISRAHANTASALSRYDSLFKRRLASAAPQPLLRRNSSVCLLSLSSTVCRGRD